MKLKFLATYWELKIESGKIFKVFFFFLFPKFGVLKRVKFHHFKKPIAIEPNWWVSFLNFGMNLIIFSTLNFYFDTKRFF
jgi:hypothetical protein